VLGEEIIDLGHPHKGRGPIGIARVDVSVREEKLLYNPGMARGGGGSEGRVPSDVLFFSLCFRFGDVTHFLFVFPGMKTLGAHENVAAVAAPELDAGWVVLDMALVAEHHILNHLARHLIHGQSWVQPPFAELLTPVSP